MASPVQKICEPSIFSGRTAHQKYQPIELNPRSPCPHIPLVQIVLAIIAASLVIFAILAILEVGQLAHIGDIASYLAYGSFGVATILILANCVLCRVQRNPFSNKQAFDESKEVVYEETRQHEEFDNDWLTQKCIASKKRNLYAAPEAYIDDDSYILGELLNLSTTISPWEVSQYFPKRTCTKESVGRLDGDALAALRSEDFFAIIDLINPDQAFELIQRTDVADARKNGFYFFNKAFAFAYTHYQRTLFLTEVDSQVQEAAQVLFEQLKKYDSSEMQTLQNSPAYETLENQRMAPSGTLTGRNTRGTTANSEYKKCWQALNNEYLSNGLATPITKELIIKINSALRQPCLDCPKPEKTGFRQPTHEVSFAQTHSYFTPSYLVEEEVERLIQELDRDLEACSRGEKNPIVVAALFYQQFVTIHPCYDGNGRTSRFVADLILRKFGLLPAAWKGEEKDFNVGIMPFAPSSSTPTQAVELMMEALKESYRIIAMEDAHIPSNRLQLN